MGSKRAFSEVEPEAMEEEYYEEEAGEDAGPAKRHKKSHKAQEGTNSFHKKRARDIERQLQRAVDMPADVRKNLEREMASHKAQLETFSNKKKRKEMISKYHMIRFFERKKAQRLEKQLKARLEKATDPKEMAEINADLHIASVDWHYAIYHPFMERYVSLYPPENSEDADKSSSAARQLHAKRPEMWSVIEKTMDEGQDALEKLQNRKPAVDDSRAKPPSKKFSKKPMAAKAPLPNPKNDTRHEKTTDTVKIAKDTPDGLNRRERRKAERLSGRKMEKPKPKGDEGMDGGDFFEL